VSSTCNQLLTSRDGHLHFSGFDRSGMRKYFHTSKASSGSQKVKSTPNVLTELVSAHPCLFIGRSFLMVIDIVQRFSNLGIILMRAESPCVRQVTDVSNRADINHPSILLRGVSCRRIKDRLAEAYNFKGYSVAGVLSCYVLGLPGWLLTKVSCRWS
jgi:hypothetical protein